MLRMGRLNLHIMKIRSINNHCVYNVAHNDHLVSNN